LPPDDPGRTGRLISTEAHVSEREPEGVLEQDRRAFLGAFGKAAVAAPPVVTMLLSTSMASPAIAASTGGDPPRHVTRIYYTKDGPVIDRD
jgi:hypothetical protein